jgi:hypothetical protein
LSHLHEPTECVGHISFAFLSLPFKLPSLSFSTWSTPFQEAVKGKGTKEENLHFVHVTTMQRNFKKYNQN